MTDRADDIQAYYDDRQGRASTVEGAAGNDPAVWDGEVRLDCPRGHRIHWLTVDLDHNFHPTIQPSDRRPIPQRDGLPVLVSADLHNGTEDDEARGDHVRWAVKCPKCGYTGTILGSTLLAHFLLARRWGTRSVKLEG